MTYYTCSFNDTRSYLLGSSICEKGTLGFSDVGEGLTKIYELKEKKGNLGMGECMKGLTKIFELKK